MKMLTLKISAIVVFLASVPACVVSPAGSIHVAKDLEQDFEARANRMWLTRPTDDYSFDRTVILIGGSFGPKLGISLVGQEIGATGSADSNYLEAAVFKILEDQPESSLNIDLVGASVLNYRAKVSVSEVTTVFDSFSNTGFFKLNSESKKPPSDPETYVLDGMGYFIEAQIDGRKNLIVRSSCEIGTSSDIKTAKALFDLARQKFSTLSNLLSEMEYMALSDVPC